MNLRSYCWSRRPHRAQPGGHEDRRGLSTQEPRKWFLLLSLDKLTPNAYFDLHGADPSRSVSVERSWLTRTRPYARAGAGVHAEGGAGHNNHWVSTNSCCRSERGATASCLTRGWLLRTRSGAVTSQLARCGLLLLPAAAGGLSTRARTPATRRGVLVAERKKCDGRRRNPGAIRSGTGQKSDNKLSAGEASRSGTVGQYESTVVRAEAEEAGRGGWCALRLITC